MNIHGQVFVQPSVSISALQVGTGGLAGWRAHLDRSSPRAGACVSRLLLLSPFSPVCKQRLMVEQFPEMVHGCPGLWRGEGEEEALAVTGLY